MTLSAVEAAVLAALRRCFAEHGAPDHFRLELEVSPETVQAFMIPKARVRIDRATGTVTVV